MSYYGIVSEVVFKFLRYCSNKQDDKKTFLLLFINLTYLQRWC